MRLWNWLYLQPGFLMPDQAKGAEWNRGRYLVEGLGHCGACHTPKTWLGGDKRDQAFGGSRVDTMFAPRLDAAARSGLKSWSAEDIAEYLQSGRNAKSHAGPLMSEVVLNSTSKMSDGDIKAIAVYLKSLPSGAAEPKVAPPSSAQMADGEKVYRGACIACHEADGSSAPRIYPPLPANANLQSCRSHEHHPHHSRRRRKHHHAARAEHGIDAGLCRKALRPGDRRCHDLHPQRLGQRGAGGDGAEIAKARQTR